MSLVKLPKWASSTMMREGDNERPPFPIRRITVSTIPTVTSASGGGSSCLGAIRYGAIETFSKCRKVESKSSILCVSTKHDFFIAALSETICENTTDFPAPVGRVKTIRLCPLRKESRINSMDWDW